MKVVYLIGAPGSGKTTVSKAFMRDWVIENKEEKPVKHQIYRSEHGKTMSLGWSSEHFGGTDTLGNTAIEDISEWLPEIAKENLYTILYAEGDKLANDRFFQLARQHAEFHLFYLDTDQDVAQERRRLRSLETGKEQNETWVKGRITKATKLAGKYKTTFIPDDLTPTESATLMWRKIIS